MCGVCGQLADIGASRGDIYDDYVHNGGAMILYVVYDFFGEEFVCRQRVRPLAHELQRKLARKLSVCVTLSIIYRFMMLRNAIINN